MRDWKINPRNWNIKSRLVLLMCIITFGIIINFINITNFGLNPNIILSLGLAAISLVGIMMIWWDLKKESNKKDKKDS